MHRMALLLVALVAVFGVAAVGCGGEDEASPTADTVTGTDTNGTEETETDTTEEETTEEDTTEEDTTEETETDGGDGGEGNPEAGKTVFTTHCASCHTLQDAGTSGTVGPDLDDSQPDFDLVKDRVTNGQGAMPAFRDTLSEQEINDVAAYVSTAAGS
jgi:mono/diheme cytochrome c family protein